MTRLPVSGCDTAHVFGELLPKAFVVFLCCSKVSLVRAEYGRYEPPCAFELDGDGDVLGATKGGVMDLLVIDIAISAYLLVCRLAIEV